MANYPTQFSFELDNISDRERLWLTAVLSALDAEDPHGTELAEIIWEPDSEPECIGFAAEIQEHPAGPVLWIHAEDDGTPEHAAAFVQEFLRRFRPQARVGFSWANTCSRPLSDAFGGGAVLITASELRWMGTAQWLGEQLHCSDAGG